MRTIARLALACVSLTAVQAAQAEQAELVPYFRNVNPTAPAPVVPVTGGGTDTDGGTNPTNPTTPTTPVTPPAEPVPEVRDCTTPLGLVQTPPGDITATSGADIRIVFHATAGCGSPSLTLTGANPTDMARYGLTIGRQGEDYVISGRYNQAALGGTYNLHVTAQDSRTSRTIDTALNFNPAPPGYDPPWDFQYDVNRAYSNTAFALGPDFRNHGSNYEPVDTTGYTFTLHTLDPVARPIPSWISIDAATGVVRGMAPAGGSYGPFYVRARMPGANGFTADADFSIGVIPRYVLDSPTLVEAPINEPVTLTFRGHGGCGTPYPSYSLASDPQPPPGMQSGYADDHWVVTGTPTSAGDWPIKLSYNDYGCPGSQLFPVTIRVTGAEPDPLSFDGGARMANGGLPIPVRNVYGDGVYADIARKAPAPASVTCDLVDGNGAPANLAFASKWIEDPTRCGFFLRPDQDGQVGSYTVRLRATSDAGEIATSDPVTFTVTAAEPPAPAAPAN